MKKNLVLIGYGGIGSRLHVPNALKSDVVNLLGIYDIDPEKSKKAAENGLYAYPSLEAVLEDDRVDLVTIATPNDTHKELVVTCLKGGKHVICEKPAAMNSDELAVMIETSKETGKVFTIHQNRRWDQDFLAMKEIYQSGKIGDVFDLRSYIHGSRGIPGDWRREKAHGGGMVLDWGVHLIDQVLQIIPHKISSLYCQLDFLTGAEVDDGFKLYLTFENGCQAHIEVGTYNFISMPRFYMRGRKGSAIIADWQEPTKIVECTEWTEQSEIVPIKTAAGMTKTMAPRDGLSTKEYTWPIPKADVHNFYRNVVKAIDGEETLAVRLDEVMRVFKVMEAAFASGEKNEVIALNL